MKIKPVLAAVALSAMTAGLFVAPAEALTCYTVEFDHLPNAWAQANPPSVTVDDGNPRVRSYPC